MGHHGVPEGRSRTCGRRACSASSSTVEATAISSQASRNVTTSAAAGTSCIPSRNRANAAHAVREAVPPGAYPIPYKPPRRRPRTGHEQEHPAERPRCEDQPIQRGQRGRRSRPAPLRPVMAAAPVTPRPPGGRTGTRPEGSGRDPATARGQQATSGEGQLRQQPSCRVTGRSPAAAPRRSHPARAGSPAPRGRPQTTSFDRTRHPVSFANTPQLRAQSPTAMTSPRLRGRLDSPAQRLDHVVSDHPGHQHDVGMPRRGDQPGAVTLGVIDRAEGGADLDLAPVARAGVDVAHLGAPASAGSHDVQRPGCGRRGVGDPPGAADQPRIPRLTGWPPRPGTSSARRDAWSVEQSGEEPPGRREDLDDLGRSRRRRPAPRCAADAPAPSGAARRGAGTGRSARPRCGEQLVDGPVARRAARARGSGRGARAT